MSIFLFLSLNIKASPGNSVTNNLFYYYYSHIIIVLFRWICRETDLN